MVRVRGPVEALSAAKGGARIADVEHPTSDLGTSHPLNIKAVRQCLYVHFEAPVLPDLLDRIDNHRERSVAE